jgi:hypothetical protein
VKASISKAANDAIEEPFLSGRFWTLIITHRVLIIVAAASAFSLFPHENNIWNRIYDGMPGANHLLSAFANWDGQNYLLIAKSGYGDVPTHRWAFYPLLPWCLRGIFLFIPNVYVAGIVLVGLCTAIFLRFFVFYVQAHGGSQRIWLAIALLLSHPAAFYTGVIYSEALFLALLFTWLWYYHNKSWVALLPAALLPLTRPHAFIILPAFLASILWRVLKDRQYPDRHDLVNVAAILAGISVYFLFFKWATGNAFAGFDAQRMFSSFGNSITNVFNPLNFFEHLLTPTTRWFAMSYGLVDKLAILVMLAGTLYVAKLRDGLIFCLYLAMAYVPAAMGAGGSYLRFSLLPMPLLALSLVRHVASDIVLWSIVAVATCYQLFFMGRFALNKWVG